MKINRLIEIITILLNREAVTAKELANRFGVSTRTIYRDIDALSSVGVHVNEWLTGELIRIGVAS